MERSEFKERLKQYKKAREENPGLKYWEWKFQPAEKDIPKYDEGTDGIKVVPYIPEYKGLTYAEFEQRFKKEAPVEYNRLQEKVARNTQSGEIVHYIDANGNKQSVTNAKGLEIVSPEFDLLTAIRSFPELAFKSFDFKNNVNIGDKWNRWGSESLVQSIDDHYFKIPQKGFKELNDDFAKAVRKKLRFNELPENTRVPYTYEGYVIDGKGHYFPVVKQKAVRQHADESINNQLFTDIQNEFKKAGYSANTKYAGAQNKWYNVQDYSPNQNIGELNGKGVLFDAILGESYTPQFIKAFKENYEFIKNRPFITGLNTVSENIENFADGGEVTGPPTYDDWYTNITTPKLNAFDDAYLHVNINDAVADLHNIAMTLPGYANKWNEYQRSRPKEDPSIDAFVNDLWANENPNNVGYKKGRYYPHKSPEGGAATIGPGFKIGSGSHRITEKEANKGVTRARLDREAARVGQQHLDAVNQFLNYGQTTNPADTVSPQIKIGLMDLRHQVGPLNGWHNLRNAVLEGDLDRIKKESTVTWEDNGKTRVDTRRKKIRDTKYFHY